MANLPNRHSGPPLPPQSPQHRASAPGPGEHDKYLAELLQERQKLTPFIPVLPNCSRLLNAEIARTSKLVGEMLQDSDQHTGAAPSNSAYAQSGLLSGSNASPAPPVPSYSSYEPVAPWQQPMSSYDSLLPDAQIRPPAQQQGYGAAPPSMPLTGGNPYGGTVGGGGSSYGGPGGGPGGAGGSSMYGAPGGGSAYGAPGGAPGGGSAYGGPGGAPGGGSAYGGPGGGGPTYGTVYGGGDAMIQQQGPLMMRRARRFDIAVDKFPAQVNCVARILGLKGATLRHIESTTGCRLLIRGRGSIKDQKKEAVMFGKPGYEHLMEPLHVMIEAEMPAHVVEYHINQASEMIENALLGLSMGTDPPPPTEERVSNKRNGPPAQAKGKEGQQGQQTKKAKLFNPDGRLSQEDFERSQSEGVCFLCREHGHRVRNCPLKPPEERGKGKK